MMKIITLVENTSANESLTGTKRFFGSEPDYVISGFHMMMRDGEHTEKEKAVIIRTARELSQMKTVFYSGHCTGTPAFELMKKIMGEQLIALHSSEQIL